MTVGMVSMKLRQMDCDAGLETNQTYLIPTSTLSINQHQAPVQRLTLTRNLIAGRCIDIAQITFEFLCGVFKAFIDRYTFA